VVRRIIFIDLFTPVLKPLFYGRKRGF